MVQERKKRGFECLTPERRKEVARSGGMSVPAAKRAFATKPGLAASAGSAGGKASRGGGRRPKAPSS